MALIIDGSTYRKWWKFTADHTAPNEYQMIPKHASIDYTVTAATEGSISYGLTGYATDATTIDENGNELDTSAKVAKYLNENL